MLDLTCNILGGENRIKFFVKVLKEAKKINISHLSAGERYIYGEPFLADAYITEIIDSLNEISAELELGVTVLRGNILVGDCFLPSVLKDVENMTVAGSRYLLIELPGYSIPAFWPEMCLEYSRMGIVIICAGAEKHPYIQENHGVLEEFASRGILFSLGCDSILGKNGEKAKAVAEIMIKKGLVTFVGSFSENEKSKLPHFYRSYGTIAQNYGVETAQRLYITNPAKIIYNEASLF
ncbi:MAG: hypothetical protein LBI03_03410 [Clostridiales bacterium]|jgi:protein-tyrosine phosphatase|nr:hypothetical protein [Clostridiales bacterium]